MEQLDVVDLDQWGVFIPFVMNAEQAIYRPSRAFEPSELNGAGEDPHDAVERLVATQEVGAPCNDLQRSMDMLRTVHLRTPEHNDAIRGLLRRAPVVGPSSDGTQAASCPRT